MDQNDGSKVKVIEETQDYNYQDRYKIFRARLQYRKSDGQMSKPVSRLNFERGSAVGVLLYDPARDTVLLVRQFRYPVYASLPGDQRGGMGSGVERAWLPEIVAGVMEHGQSAEETARREVSEEVGLEIQGSLQRIADVFTSPGVSSERVTIFIAQVDSSARDGQGGGLAGEGEDIELLALPRSEALAMLARGDVHDAKTVIALQYLAARRDLPSPAPANL